MEMIMPRGHPLAEREMWTPERKKQARDLWMGGHTAKYIGDQMGKTRRSVMGALDRMGLLRVERPKNPMPTPQPQAGRRGVKTYFGKQKKRSDGQPVNTITIKLPPPSMAGAVSCRPEGKVTLMELTATTCRWPLGDPQDPDFGYCGAGTDGIHTYCIVHGSIAYTHPPRRV